MENLSRNIGRTLGVVAANWITLFGGLLALLGIYLFTIDHDWLAIVVLTISFLSDSLDGLVSRHHESLRRAAGLSQSLSISG